MHDGTFVKFNNVAITTKALLCHGCGICTAVCPQNAISITYDKKRMNYIAIVEQIKCHNCGICMDVCPGGEVQFGLLAKHFLDIKNHSFLGGYFLNNYLGWATDKDIRWRAASGGIATAIAKHLLESKKVTKILLIKSQNNSDALAYSGALINNADALYEAMGSKYCAATLCGALKNINTADKLAVIGLPCHIHGIRKAQIHSKRFKQHNIIAIGLFCGGTRGKEATEYLLKRNGFNIKDLTWIKHRTIGWPGQMLAKFANEKKFQASYPGYSNLQFNSFTPWRCKLCSDGLAELADISIGDAWLKEITAQNSEGISIIVTRSQEGEKIIEDAISSGIIKCENINNDDAVRSQHKMLIGKKCDIASRMLMAKIIARNVPIYDNIVDKISAFLIIKLLRDEIIQYAGRLSAKYNFIYKMLECLRYFFHKIR